ncbi:RRP15-like protein [Rhodnius prolixus]|uniref:RRP15-like protein n=1 Tax=Rhodnius prolixus TaxID=13249 RepID=UPI003D18B089
MKNSDGNSGWADAMGKILVVKKPKKNKTIILSKGKKLSLMKNENEEPNNVQLNSESGIKKCEIFTKGRKKPDILEKDRERKLQKITVKGVVKLFNAVNKHQQTNKDEIESSGPVMTKKEKALNSVSKSSFLNYLMGEKNEDMEHQEPKQEFKSEESNDEEEDQIKQVSSTWEVLQNNYGIGIKMKNWVNRTENSN